MDNISNHDLAKILVTLREVRDTATMRNASFGWDKVTTTCNPMNPDGGMGGGTVEVPVTEFIQRRTRVWRESWIIGQLDEAIAKLEEAVGA